MNCIIVSPAQYYDSMIITFGVNDAQLCTFLASARLVARLAADATVPSLRTSLASTTFPRSAFLSKLLMNNPLAWLVLSTL
jgi:hypothetical protein